MIELLQKKLDNLSENARFLHQVSVYPRMYPCDSGSGLSFVLLEEKFFSLSPNIRIVDNVITIIVEVPNKYFNEEDPLLLISDSNLNLSSTKEYSQRNELCTFVVKRFLICLKEKEKSGHISFLVNSNTVKINDKIFTAGDVVCINVYESIDVYRKNKNYCNSIKASSKKVFFPILPNQKLEIVLDNDFQVLEENIKMDYCFNLNNNLNICSFSCTDLSDTEQKISFIKDEDIFEVVFPTIVTDKDNNIYCCIDSSTNKSFFGVFCHNLFGILFEDKEKENWYYNEDVFKVDYNDCGVIITFLNNQKYVTIDRTKSFWGIVEDEYEF